jgi:hypothetical protein
MKKYTFIMTTVILLITLFSPNSLLAQTKNSKKSTIKQEKKSDKIDVKKQTNIDGLGIFKIGKTDISIITDLENEFGTKSVVTSDSFELIKAKGRNNSIFQLVPKNKSGYDQFSICPDVKEYQIPVYNIADMQIEKLHLKFYKDVLYNIECDSSKELGEALELKYGEPELKVENKPISCIYKASGNTVTYEEKTFTSSWYNGNIRSNNILHSYYSDKCENRRIKYFNIYDTKILETVYKCEEDLREQGANMEKQKRLKNLKDF